MAHVAFPQTAAFQFQLAVEVPQFVAANSQPQVIALSNQTTLLENRGRVSSCSEMVNMTLPGQLPITNNHQVRHPTGSLNYNSRNAWQAISKIREHHILFTNNSLNLAWPSWWTFCAVCLLSTRPNVSCLTKSHPRRQYCAFRRFISYCTH